VHGHLVEWSHRSVFCFAFARRRRRRGVLAALVTDRPYNDSCCSQLHTMLPRLIFGPLLNRKPKLRVTLRLRPSASSVPPDNSGNRKTTQRSNIEERLPTSRVGLTGTDRPTFIHFDKIHEPDGRWTDTQTLHDSIDPACTASRGSKMFRLDP